MVMRELVSHLTNTESLYHSAIKFRWTQILSVKSRTMKLQCVY